ncbi:MAG: alkaline phosphatase family protein [Boseongicola sp. SB0673_bin_14]|nr:alkaline phosphatase family protein [Boseongicola sp. SB0673_bin_14]
MTGTSEQRIAEALERIDGNLGRIADVLEEGGLNDIADAFTIIAMAVTGMEPELEDEDLPEHLGRALPVGLVRAAGRGTIRDWPC